MKKDQSIVQELYNQNFEGQKSQESGQFVSQCVNKFSVDFDNQHYNLLGVNDLINARATSLDKQIEGLKAKTVFIRTPRELDKANAGDFQLLYFLNLFGMKTIINDQLSYANFQNDRMDFYKDQQDEFKRKYDH